MAPDPFPPPPPPAPCRPRVGRAHGRAPSRTSGPAWAALLSVSGLVGLAFGLGMAVAELDVFPSPVVRAATEAARDWRAHWRHYLQIRSRFTARTDRVGSGVTVRDPTAAYPGYTFLTGYRDGRYHAFLVDVDGTVRHEWGVAFSEVWPDPRHLEIAPPDFDVAVHGAALLPGGEVVLNLEGAGTVKLDRCSRVLWSIPEQTHHTVEPLPGGGFLISARRKLRHPGPGLPGVHVPEQGWLWEDVVLRVDPQGRVVEEFSVLRALLASGLEALLYANGQDYPSSRLSDDPLHLNDVEVLREEMAGAFPSFAPGDLMVSLRNLDTIAVLDRDTHLVKWRMTGPFLRQHDPG